MNGQLDANVAKVAQYFLFALLLVFLSDIPDTYPLVCLMAKASLYGMLFLTILLPNRLGLVFLLMLAVVGQDIVQTNAQRESGTLLLASIWQGSLGPLRPSWVFMLYCMVLVVKNRALLMERTVAYALFWFATVPFIAAYVYGSFSTSDASVEVLNDLKAPLFLIVSILIYGTYLKNHPRSYVEFGMAFLGAVLARHAVDFGYAVIGSGAQFGDVLRVSIDSTKGTVVFLLLFSLFLVLRQKFMFVGKALAVASALLLVVYATRGLWVSALLGMVIFARMLKVERLLFAVPVIGGVGYGSLVVLSMMFPDTIDLAGKRLDERMVGQADNIIERYFPTRYAQILNATDATVSRRAILWGSGYGGYYTESVREFTGPIDSAFSEHSIATGQYYTLHHFVFRTLFEYGVIGLVLMSALWLVPGWRCYRAYQNPSSSLISGITVAMIAFLPTSMLEMTWTSKGMIIGGFAIAYFQCAYKFSGVTTRTARAVARSRRPMSAAPLRNYRAV